MIKMIWFYKIKIEIIIINSNKIYEIIVIIINNG